MRLCSIPAGSFWMGSDPPEGADNEHPRRRVETGAYRIGETPVTNGEFANFVQNSYLDRACWSDEGWAWREANGIVKPRFWGDDAWRAYLAPDQPIVGVSWYEADAFSRSLETRLPTEAEWERAARGDQGLRYPWGDEWVPEYAAHRGGARNTLPVRSFPQNRSPWGLYDCAGNVWEWCADRYEDRVTPGVLRAAMVSGRGTPSALRAATLSPTLRSARGGSWNAHPPQLRCASRNAWPPGARFSNLGLRVCAG